jgi:hypothetical protein
MEARAKLPVGILRFTGNPLLRPAEIRDPRVLRTEFGLCEPLPRSATQLVIKVSIKR